MIRPFLIGAAMPAMMLWMGHERIMSGEMMVTAGAVIFLLAHVAAVAVILSLALLSPRMRHALKRHRPSLSHMSVMLCGMVLAAGTIHLVIHGVLA